MRTAVLAAAAAATAVSLPIPPDPGCGSFGCGPYNTWTTGLILPQQLPTVRWKWNAGVTQEQAASPPQPVRQAAASPGCITAGPYITCPWPFRQDNSSWAGLVRLDASSGNETWRYTGTGSSRCDAYSPSQPAGSRVQAMPLSDVFGNVISWDNSAIIGIVNGEVQWNRQLLPSAACPVFLSSVVASNASEVLFFLAPSASEGPSEAFGYVADGVPLASLRLFLNGSSESMLVPISEQAMSGVRAMYLSRLYTTTGNGTQTTVTAQPDIYLTAVDIHQVAVPRMTRPFDLPLLPALSKAVAACLPTADGSEQLLIAGPLLTPNSTAVVALSCPTANKSSSSVLQVVSMAVDAPQPVVPAVAWVTAVALPEPGAQAQSLAADPAYLTSAAYPQLLWLTAQGSSWLTALDAGSGVQVKQLSMATLLQQSKPSNCALGAASVNEYLPTSRPLLSLVNATDASQGSLLVIAGIASIRNGMQTSILTAFQLQAVSGSLNATVAWCIPTPAGQPLFGQLAVASLTAPGAAAGAGSTSANPNMLILPLADGIYALQ